MNNANAQTASRRTRSKPAPKHLCRDCKDTGTIERQVPRTIGRGSNGEIVTSTHTVTARFACDCRQGWSS